MCGRRPSTGSTGVTEEQSRVPGDGCQGGSPVSLPRFAGEGELPGDASPVFLTGIDARAGWLLACRGLTLHTALRFDARGGIMVHRLSRLVTHAIVLVVAIGVASYSSASHGLPS